MPHKWYVSRGETDAVRSWGIRAASEVALAGAGVLDRDQDRGAENQCKYGQTDE